MKRYIVEISFDVPEFVLEKAVLEWIEYQTHYRCSLSEHNPLIDEELEAKTCILNSNFTVL